MKKICSTILMVCLMFMLCACNVSVETVSVGELEKPIIIGDTYQLEVQFTPDGETAKVKYSSDNQEVATVDNNGVITAVGIGKANITVKVTDEITSTAEIEIVEDTPYYRLSENERTVVDLVSKISYQFKNPNSINITAVSKSSTFDNYSCVEVCISAQNGFGGYSSSYYLITEDNGKLELTNMDDYYALLTTFNPIENIDIDGINEALKDKI